MIPTAYRVVGETRRTQRHPHAAMSTAIAKCEDLAARAPERDFVTRNRNTLYFVIVELPAEECGIPAILEPPLSFEIGLILAGQSSSRGLRAFVIAVHFFHRSVPVLLKLSNIQAFVSHSGDQRELFARLTAPSSLSCLSPSGTPLDRIAQQPFECGLFPRATK